MTLLELIKREDALTRRNIIIGATLCGLANAGLLAVINASTSAKGGEPANPRMFLIFLLLMAIYYLCYRYTFHKTTAIFQSALHKVKVRVADKIRRAEYQELEKLGVAEIYDRIAESLTVISDSATALTTCVQSAVMVGFTAIYMASLSMVAFGLTFALVAAGLSIYTLNAEQIKAYLRHTALTRLSFFDGLTDLLKGAKEVKFNHQRGEDLYQDIHAIADSLRGSTEKAHHLLDDNTLFAQCNFFALLGAVAFIVPQYVSIESESTTSLIAGIIFIMGPLSGVILGIPAFTRANLAAENIQVLETKLSAACGGWEEAETAHDPWPSGRFGKIEARDLVYHYFDDASQDGFQIGPLDLDISSGEILFIVGGNGSGKSTLLKVLTALYSPSSGHLLMDGRAVDRRSAPAYRQRFSVIFGDFHLFKKLYGLGGVDEARVRELLRQMQIDRKTSFVDGRFTTLDLSTGQRKRLAMIVALLEDREIYAFDEWAADQDPEFRRYFYQEMIQDLKRQGKTVIVVTHDDQYFHCADRVVTMEYGRIRSVREGTP
ncbi:cyclic peptide export ABC transporter [Methylogaea oryzae]|uniref:Peptide ABC transporter ATP-binding protein n=1 Tax=Methylogaea oryzae TaxID=1295382 RepID=A0A8D5AMC5_9GAMM|nr:cyclic peptide export ABC transporter [Methylogaea oryzae]BBL70965.1 peptide ABC transporter ATP-binding protein [Methylogaea oryzae]